MEHLRPVPVCKLATGSKWVPSMTPAIFPSRDTSWANLCYRIACATPFNAAKATGDRVTGSTVLTKVSIIFLTKRSTWRSGRLSGQRLCHLCSFCTWLRVLQMARQSPMVLQVLFSRLEPLSFAGRFGCYMGDTWLLFSGYLVDMFRILGFYFEDAWLLFSGRLAVIFGTLGCISFRDT